MKKRGTKHLLERAVIWSKRLKDVKGLNEIEQTFFALGFAATPEERWEINRFWVNRMPPAARKAMEAEMIKSADFSLKP